MPLSISAVLPAFDRAASLPRAVASVLGQTRPPDELFVVDDASTDDTAAVLAGLADPRLRVIRHERNRGACAARNSGIAAARGELVAFHDSDDLWLPEKLERQLAAFEADPAIGVVYSGFWYVRDGEREYRPSGAVRGHDGDVLEPLLWGNFVNTPTAVVRADRIRLAGGFDERLPRFQDWEFFIRVARHARFRFLDEPLVEARHTPGSLSDDRAARIDAIRIVLETHRELFRADRARWAHFQYLLGTWSCRDGRMREGRRHLLAALRAQPGRPRHLAALTAALLGPRAYRRLAGAGGA